MSTAWTGSGVKRIEGKSIHQLKHEAFLKTPEGKQGEQEQMEREFQEHREQIQRDNKRAETERQAREQREKQDRLEAEWLEKYNALLELPEIGTIITDPNTSVVMIRHKKRPGKIAAYTCIAVVGSYPDEPHRITNCSKGLRVFLDDADCGYLAVKFPDEAKYLMEYSCADEDPKCNVLVDFPIRIISHSSTGRCARGAFVFIPENWGRGVEESEQKYKPSQQFF